MTAIGLAYHPGRIELRHLRYFVAVAETLNYRKAAQRLHVAQPTLSSQIKDLESELGVQLLDRNTHGVRLTQAGAAFLKAVRATFAQLRRAVERARETANAQRGKLTVGYIASFLDRFMPSGLAAFRLRFPDVDVNLVEIALGDQIKEVTGGKIQVGFMLRNRNDPPCVLGHLQIAQSQICAVMYRSHRLAGRHRIALRELVGERLICLAARRGSPREHLAVMRRIFLERGLKPRPIRQVAGTESFRAMLESGLGVSLVVGIGSLSQSRQLVLIPISGPGDDLRVELLAIWKEEPPSKQLTGFVDCVREATIRANTVRGGSD